MPRISNGMTTVNEIARKITRISIRGIADTNARQLRGNSVYRIQAPAMAHPLAFEIKAREEVLATQEESLADERRMCIDIGVPRLWVVDYLLPRDQLETGG